MSNEPISYATVADGARLETNRRGGLIAFGVISILLGVPPTFATALMGIGLARMLVIRDAWPFLADIAMALIAGGVAAAVFFWVGIDSIRCRRWVRPVVVALAVPTLVTSVLMSAGLVLYSATSVPSGPDEGLVTGLIIFLLLFGGIVPFAFLAFYSMRSVRETLAVYDPSPSWTERSPLPVFVGCVSLVLFGLFAAALSVLRATPVFGVYVTGPAGSVLAIAAGATMVASGVLMHLGRAWAWWLALGVVVGGFASAIVTFARLGMMEFYRRGGMSPFNLAEVQRSSAMTGVTPIVFVGIVLAIAIGYLVWMRPFMYRRGDGIG